VKRKLIVATMAAVTVATVFGYRAYAHHSFAATYIEDQEMTIEGELVNFMFRNPHSWVHVMGVAKEDKTNTQYRWAVEWGGGSRLERENVTRESLKAGDRVVITGSPGRNPADHRLRMKSIRRLSDGWGWSGVVE
jgi:hypothetical protein